MGTIGGGSVVDAVWEFCADTVRASAECLESGVLPPESDLDSATGGWVGEPEDELWAAKYPMPRPTTAMSAITPTTIKNFERISSLKMILNFPAECNLN